MKTNLSGGGTGWALGLAAGAWMPVLLVLVQMGRIEWGLVQSDRTLRFLPGTSWLAGESARLGINWLHAMGLSGSALLLSVALLVGLAGRRRVQGWSAVRWRIQAGPVVAMGLMLTWVLTIDHREFDQNVLPILLVFYTPILAVSYALLGSGLGRVRSIAVGGLLLFGLAGVIAIGQAQFEQPGREMPEISMMFWGSVPLGLAVAMRLGIWGWAGDREPPGTAEAASV